ncbi:MAG: PAS domain S-box protein, partial [Bacteroidales bacterium]|nr:PAS domain S-box protein [Bacteroidales bacterium]
SGVVVVNIDAENEFFNIMTNRIGLGETGEVYLINKHGYMITPSRFVDNAVLKQKIDIDHSENCINVYPGIKPNKAPKIGLYKNYMGQDVLRVHTHIPEVEWVLVVDVSTEEIFIPVFKLSNRLLIILIILLVAGVIISVVLSRTITRPVLKLHHGIEELEKGNLDFKVGTKAKDEIGELSRGFDKMTGELKKSKEILEDLNYELEQKVKVRTTELNAKINESEHQRIATLNILQEVDEVNKNLKQEISERVKTEKALQESEKKYRLLAENTLDCIWKTDKDMRFTYVNPAIFPMLGFTPEEWTGSSLSEHCSENEFKKAKNIIAEEMRKDDTYSATFEIALIHKDGKDIPVEINGKILIDENKNIVGLQGTTRDITERKIAAKELEQRLAELEIYYKATLGREGRIIELKQEINRLLERLGEKSRFGV